MPPKRRKKPLASACTHSRLEFQSSPLAAAGGCVQHTPQQLFTAATGKSKRVSGETAIQLDFPAPLGLPGDLLLDDPRYPPQSFRSWLNLAGRNAMTERRRVLYVAEPPIVAIGAQFMQDPGLAIEVEPCLENAVFPDIEEIVSYLKAFFHDVDVRRLPNQLSWVPWEESNLGGSSGVEAKAALPEHVALQTREEVIRVRVRQTGSVTKPKKDRTDRDTFRYQVNQLDLLDVAQAALPADAYAMLLMVNHDLYEDADDDFCCGRAFGGSRIAVVSTARYDPRLDQFHGVDREHAWPASHCADFVARTCGIQAKFAATNKRRRAEDTKLLSVEQGALSLAVEAQLEISSKFDARTTYLLRVCRTASHETGHCFGMDHCMYYACSMQGTSSLLEDNRQPPYLCPVCESKIGYAVATASGTSVSAWKEARHEAMLAFCSLRGGSFEPLAAWTRHILSGDRQGSTERDTR